MSKRDANYTFSGSEIQRYWSTYFYFPMLIVDENGAVSYANPRMEELTGYSKEEIAVKELREIIGFDRPLDALHRALNEQCATSLISEPRLVHVRTAGGSLLVMDYFMMKVIETGDYLIVLRDTKDSAVNLFQRFSKTFLQDVNLGVLVVDRQFKCVEISDMACRILGFDKVEILGKTLEQAFASVPIEHHLVQRTILDGLVVRNHAISWMNNQKRYELLLDSNVLRGDEGQIVGAYILFKDVTNLRSLEEQVQRSDRLAMIGQIAAGTAHEIRNPLTSIKGFLQLFRKSFEGLGLYKEQGYVDVMLTEINRVNELVNEFLMLSKPKHVTFRPTQLSHVLQEIMPIIRSEALMFGVELLYEPLPELPQVIADQELLKQVFLNICKNGIEALSDEGGVLTVNEKIDTEERFVRIEVHDTGPGIPMFVIDKIFDPFFTTKEDGTGLGLSVCQRIIHDLGGNIRVASKGFGTTFTISIPYA